MPLANDVYGRTVSVSTVGSNDIYTVNSGEVIVTYPTGTDLTIVYKAIEGNAPSTYIPTPDTVDTTAEYSFNISSSNTTPLPKFTYDASLFKGAVLKAVIVQSVTLESKIVTMSVSNSTTKIASNETSASTNSMDVTFDCALSGGYVTFTCTNSTGNSCDIKAKIEVLKV